jgi:hypothetical protein
VRGLEESKVVPDASVDLEGVLRLGTPNNLDADRPGFNVYDVYFLKWITQSANPCAYNWVLLASFL